MLEREQFLGRPQERISTENPTSWLQNTHQQEIPDKPLSPETTIYPPIAGGSRRTDAAEKKPPQEWAEPQQKAFFDRFQEFALTVDERLKMPDSEEIFRRLSPGIASRVDALVETGHLTKRERNLIQKAMPAASLVIPLISLAGVPFAGGSAIGFLLSQQAEVFVVNLPFGIARIWAMREIAKRHKTSFNWLSYTTALFPGGGAFVTALVESSWIIAKYYFRAKIQPNLRRFRLPRKGQ